VGWKVRSDKLELVKQTKDSKGGRQQVRWQVAQYKIQEALASRGQTLEAGLDITDFEYLAKQGLLIGKEQTKKISETMPELKHKKFSLEEIKDYFVPFYSSSIEDFLTTYLNLTNNTHGTWTKFRGNKSIEYEAFKGICTVLGLDCDEIGTDDREMPDCKKIETLLWDLNHKCQVKQFQNLAQKSHNLVCLRFCQIPQRHIPIFWLLKALLQPVDHSIEQAQIDFNSRIHSNSKQRLNAIITGLNLSQKLKDKQKYDAIAKAICKKMQADKKTIVLLFFTQEWQQFRESEELSSILYESLQKELSTLKIQEHQKLLIVSIDSQTSSQDESEAFDGDGDIDRIPTLDLMSQFTNDDIIAWTKREAVNKFINRTRNHDLNNISEHIWNQSQGRSEDLLKSVYSLCNLNWEEHQDSWQNF
jgi:hypothetical protein